MTCFQDHSFNSLDSCTWKLNHPPWLAWSGFYQHHKEKNCFKWPEILTPPFRSSGEVYIALWHRYVLLWRSDKKFMTPKPKPEVSIKKRTKARHLELSFTELKLLKVTPYHTMVSAILIVVSANPGCGKIEINTQ